MDASIPFDLVMFDLDGTLVETAPEICDAVNDTLRHFGLAEVSQLQIEQWIGHGTRELLLQAFALARAQTLAQVRSSPELPQIAAEFNQHYWRRCGTRSRLYPHVREVLQRLHGQGVRLAVVTNKENSYTQKVLAAHGLAPLFDCIISGDTLPTKKPDPAGIRRCLAQFSVATSRALFVGDSSIDVQTARNADVTVWVLPYGYNMGQSIQDCGADRVIADCSPLIF